MNNTLKNIYDNFPVYMQNLILTGFSVVLDQQRYGGDYVSFTKFLAESERMTEEALRDYQDMKLRELIVHAYETVPYYKEIMKKRGLRSSDINGQDDLCKLPLLTRKDIHENFDNLQSRAYKRSDLKLGHTSGTTGSPLEILYDRNVVYMTYAVLDRQYNWANVQLKRFGDRIAILRGNVIVPIQQQKPPFWRFNYFHNHMLLSSFHLSEENIPSYINGIKKFRPAVIDGYPSTVYVLARYLIEHNESLPLKAVLTSSETLYDFQREAIEKAFKCKIYDYFGAAERVIFATECSEHQGHHLCSEYGITEILNQHKKPVSIGEVGYMVGTSLHNKGMPMIRYLTSDMTALKENKCSCGRNLPLMEDVSTKAEDIIALKDGRYISPSVLTHPFKPMHSVKASQIIQEDYEHIVIKIVASENYSDADTRHLKNEFMSRMGNGMRIDVELVDELSRTKAGKFKWVISKVDKSIKMPQQ